MISSTVSARGAHCTGAGRITDGTEAHRLLAQLLGTLGPHPLTQSQEHAVALDHLAFVRVVDGRKFDPLAPDVLPDVELRPVRQRERAEVLARAHRALVELPQLWSLGLGIPLPERIAKERTRSLALALSSSRRAPPKAASKPCALIASSSVVVCSRLRDAIGPGSATRPWSMESCTLATRRRAPSASTCASR